MVEPEQVKEVDNRSNNNELYGLLMWGGLIATYFTGIAFLIPIILYVIKKDESLYVKEQGKDIINMLISMLIYSVIAFIIGIVTFGLGFFITVPVLTIFYFVIFIIGLVKGLNGEVYYTPLTIPFVR